MKSMNVFAGIVVWMLWLAWPTMTTLAQANRPAASPESFRGVIVGVAQDHRSCKLVDANGTTMTVQLHSDTRYTMRRGDIDFDNVVRFGMEVSVVLGPDGAATELRGRGINLHPNPAQLQAFMRATDADWAVLQPKIERVQELLASLASEQPAINTRAGRNRGDNRSAPPGTPTASNEPSSLKQARQALETNFFDDAVSPGQVASSLASLRQARAQAQAQLADARKDLIQLLTPRQEALLVMMGIVE